MKPEPFQRPITRNQFHSHVVYSISLVEKKPQSGLENLKKSRPILNCKMRWWINFTEKLYYNLFFLNFCQKIKYFFKKFFSLACCGPRRGPLVCSCSVYTYFKGPHAKIRTDILAFYFLLRQQWRDLYTF